MKLTYPFELDTFQQKAITAVNKNVSVIVSAPTGTGKTVIAEYVIKHCINQNTGVIYTSPIKALSNQKYREFRKLFSDKVGIITGDVNINPNAPLLIMTTEIFRNRILENDRAFSQYSWIIFDEIHYIDDVERGTVWEESLIFLPDNMRVVALSATIPNIGEFAAWLKSTLHTPVEIIVESHRSVPLHYFFQCRDKILDDLKMVKKIAYGKKSRLYLQHQYVKYSKVRHHPSHRHRPLIQNKPLSLIRHLAKAQRLPCIYFSFSRKRCEYLAEEASKLDFLNHDEREYILPLFDDLSIKLQVQSSERTADLRWLISKGVAYHHAGIHPMIKEIIERLFTARFIKIIFSTETFALGINMPARTVVLDELTKRYGRHYRFIKIRDFFQMAGRAGRRGIDEEGYVYSRLNTNEIGYNELNLLFSAKTEPVRSRFNASYATVLNLYEIYGENLIEVYSRSFHHFLEKHHKKGARNPMLMNKLNLLKKSFYIHDGKLTEKGHFAKRIHGYELVFSELHTREFIQKLNYLDLGVLCLALVYEPRYKDRKPQLNKNLKKLQYRTQEVVSQINLVEKRMGISPLSKNLFYDLSQSLILWMNNVPFRKIMADLDQDEGEIIRYYRMSLQLLRELLDTPISKKTKGTVHKTIELINHGVIDAEAQLINISNLNSDEEQK